MPPSGAFRPVQPFAQLWACHTHVYVPLLQRSEHPGGSEKVGTMKQDMSVWSSAEQYGALPPWQHCGQQPASAPLQPAPPPIPPDPPMPPLDPDCPPAPPPSVAQLPENPAAPSPQTYAYPPIGPGGQRSAHAGVMYTLLCAKHDMYFPSAEQ
jgi:hypothetical protein